jgi:hypothetical protein
LRIKPLIRLHRVAVYAYGAFDDDTEPIYTIKLDDEDLVTLGQVTGPDSNTCVPLYAKSGLEMGDHTITLTLTNERPIDVRDLSFNGFM